jgi:hypothetical protein
MVNSRDVRLPLLTGFVPSCALANPNQRQRRLGQSYVGSSVYLHDDKYVTDHEEGRDRGHFEANCSNPVNESRPHESLFNHRKTSRV